MKQRYNSDKTVKDILDISTSLFISKGYEKTSISDIVNHLAGLTRGAIYHHFDSKEAILLGIIDRLVPSMEIMEPIATNEELSGLTKLQKVLLQSLLNEERGAHFSVTSALLTDPKFFLLYTKRVNEAVIPDLLSFILEGNQDGSTAVQHPQQTAELLLLLLNTWFSDALYPMTMDSFWDKILVSKVVFENLGVDILSDKVMTALTDKITRKQEENEDSNET